MLFKLSRVLHKYSGLIFFFYFLLMAISGVLLNHPKLIHKISVPLQLTPASHMLMNGNRMAVREALVDGDNIYLAGRAGVWWSNDNGLNFFKIDAGFPSASYDQDTFSLSLDKKHNRLFAGTRSGLYVYSFATEQWQNILFGATDNEPVVELLQIKNRLLLFTQQHCYSSGLETQKPFFRIEPLSFDTKSRPQSARLLHFFLKVHDGSILGLGGRLFVDAIGLALIFLCATGLVIWLLPRYKKKSTRLISSKFKFQWFYSNHLKIGAYTFTFISIIVLSGMVIRPPFIKTVAAYNIPLWTLPMEHGSNWKPRIDKAAFEPETETLWIATRQGFFCGHPEFTQPLQKQPVPVPRSGMGTSVFESLPGQQLLIGSFSGLYIWDPLNHQPTSLLHYKGENPTGSRYKVTAAVIKNGNPIHVADYHRGLVPLAAKNRLQLPPQITMTAMSLWHFLFEFHNGRIFQQWLGTHTWILIPIGGVLLLSNLVTGFYDWLWHNRKVIFKKKQTEKKLPQSGIKGR
ncbi:PepSY-associated TM helix domain-containing protein [uncultured Desulfuromusa sp.]|uniref:PepSY-associated TM helix domain-containing protein n=1 Tax=uncultured Desulfuromusa sp. TaxID=219183 RepID=UPI002AA81B17|nr:PepSY-associated TM helix domain-containing protein [uncultured Desulfuromusa sp.]